MPRIYSECFINGGSIIIISIHTTTGFIHWILFDDCGGHTLQWVLDSSMAMVLWSQSSHDAYINWAEIKIALWADNILIWISSNISSEDCELQVLKSIAKSLDLKLVGPGSPLPQYPHITQELVFSRTPGVKSNLMRAISGFQMKIQGLRIRSSYMELRNLGLKID